MLCCGASQDTSSEEFDTFRLAYAALANHLQDSHFAALVSNYTGDQSIQEVLSQRFPYRSADQYCRLDEEMMRFETSWAYHAHFNFLSVACKRERLDMLEQVWTPAAQQLFPFPPAVMLLQAAAAGRIDARSWDLMRQLNRLSAIELVENERKVRVSRIEEEESHNRLALQRQRDAVEGAGFAREERLLGRNSRAAPTKFRRGSLFDVRHDRKMRRASLFETDHLATAMPSAAEASIARDAQGASEGGGSASEGGGSASEGGGKAEVFDAAVSRDAGSLLSAAAVEGHVTRSLRSASSRRRARKQQKQRNLIPRADRLWVQGRSKANALSSTSGAGAPKAHAARVDLIWGGVVPKARRLPGPARAVQFSAWASGRSVERRMLQKQHEEQESMEEAEEAIRYARALKRDTSRRNTPPPPPLAPQNPSAGNRRSPRLHELGPIVV